MRLKHPRLLPQLQILPLPPLLLNDGGIIHIALNRDRPKDSMELVKQRTHGQAEQEDIRNNLPMSTCWQIFPSLSQADAGTCVTSCFCDALRPGWCRLLLFAFTFLCGWLLPLHLKKKIMQKTCPPRQRRNSGPRCLPNSKQNVAHQIVCRGEPNIYGTQSTLAR